MNIVKLYNDCNLWSKIGLLHKYESLATVSIKATSFIYKYWSIDLFASYPCILSYTMITMSDPVYPVGMA